MCVYTHTCLHRHSSATISGWLAYSNQSFHWKLQKPNQTLKKNSFNLGASANSERDKFTKAELRVYIHATFNKYLL